MKPFFLILLTTIILSYSPSSDKRSPYAGAWEAGNENGESGLWIITDKHFSITWYTSGEFLYTEGGTWSSPSKGKIEFTWEYHTRSTDLVGQTKVSDSVLKKDKLTMDGTTWQRLDDGTGGALAGAWLITGRYRDGEFSGRTPGARRTMKILSGTKFQWIAYNVETKEFFGTGGGTYTTIDGKYTEKIEFFSRDQSRVGASLEFNYALEDGKWRHSGKSSKGDPLDEVWTRREVLGI